jgi:hypothetical protein
LILVKRKNTMLKTMAAQMTLLRKIGSPHVFQFFPFARMPGRSGSAHQYPAPGRRRFIGAGPG